MIEHEAKKDFAVRRATLDDAKEILDCLKQAFAPYRDSYTPEAFVDTVLTPEALRERFAAMIVLVASDDSGQVAGTVAYKVENHEGHIRGMAVRPEWHGCGIAGDLLDKVEADLRDLGCRAITLDTTTPLRKAIRFYEKNGFRRTGEKALFFGMDLVGYLKKI